MAVGWFVLVLGAFVVLVLTGVVGLVLFLALRQPRGRAYDPDDRPSPLERAQTAATVLTPEEWEEFRRWVEDRNSPHQPGSEGFTR